MKTTKSANKQRTTIHAQRELFDTNSVLLPVATLPHTLPAAAPVLHKAVQDRSQETNIDIEKLIRKNYALARRNQRAVQQQSWIGYTGNKGNQAGGIRSILYDPLMVDTNYYGSIRTVSPYYGRQISYRVLRTVAQKAWIINLCIKNVIMKVRPYLKPATSENQRGFRIKHTKKTVEKMSKAEQDTAAALTDFMMKTGDVDDRYRKDDLDKYTTKLLRDLFQLDQIATEIQRNRKGEPCAFWATDAATIEVALPNEAEIEYVQVVNHIPYAYFSINDLLFDCMNPRTDIEKAGYGYSIVEQAIDLVTSAINTFMYNAGFFQENKLPRGILLLQGDAGTDEVEEIEDYIVNLMSGPPTSQWRIPIIPSGKPDSGAEGSQRRFEWINLQGTDREMGFQAWFDLQLSGVVALFGDSMESLGLHSQKSQPFIGADTSPKIESSKSLVLGDVLGFLQKHFNHILEMKNPEYELEIVGYEKDDPKLILEIDKEEVGTWKSIDEKRIEKGLEPYNKPWSQVPLNPYVTQLLGQDQGGGPFGGDMGDDDEDMEGAGDDEEAGEDDSNDWDDLEDQHGETVEKSLNKTGVVRIVV